MRAGRVAFHGGIADLRAQAPEQGHRLATSDDPRALSLSGGTRVQEHPDGGLMVHGSQAEVDRYVAAVVGAGISLRALRLTEAPLEALFFMLTEADAGPPATGARPTAEVGA
jgi:ABC-2 type transport system ATP-binding protein